MFRIDPPSPPEPRVPHYAHPRFLLRNDKVKIDADYASFSIVWQRLWPAYLLQPLQEFCKTRDDPNNQSIFHKEILYEHIQKVLHEWISVVNEEAWGYHIGMRECVEIGMFVRSSWEVEWRAKVEYERRVRVWHVREHLRKYQIRAAGELRRMGFKIGL